MLRAVKEIIETVLQRNASLILRAVPLSNDTVQRRIDEMSSGVLKQLVEILSVSKHSLQIDESTLCDNESLLLRYVRFIYNMQAQGEMIFAISLPADTWATTVFNAVEKFYGEKEIPMQIYCNVQQTALRQWLGSIDIHRIDEKENT